MHPNHVVYREIPGYNNLTYKLLPNLNQIIDIGVLIIDGKIKMSLSENINFINKKTYLFSRPK